MHAQADDFPSHEARSEAAMRRARRRGRGLRARAASAARRDRRCRRVEPARAGPRRRQPRAHRADPAARARLPPPPADRGAWAGPRRSAICSRRSSAPRAEAPPLAEPAELAPLPPVAAASEATTLIEALEWHAAQHPERLHLTFLQRCDDGRRRLDLWTSRARGAARGGGTRRRAMSTPGDRVALMLPTGLDFFVGFFGVLYAGRDPGSDLSADAALADRGSSAPPDRHIAQRRRRKC